MLPENRPMTADEVLQAFDSVRRAPTRNGWAPHKPLMLLLALSRIQHGATSRGSFAEVEPKLKALLVEFGPTSAVSTRHLPFWRLRSDFDGRLWTLSGPRELVESPVADGPGLGVMRSSGIVGGFGPEIEAALRETPGLAARAARHVLDAYFPETLHADIAAALGLDIGSTAQDSLNPTRTPRDPRFRANVLLAYEKRCCVCGFDLRVGDLPAGLEAAHIHWKTAGGPDVEQNGLCLCALHHKLFDLGAYTVLPESMRIMFSRHAIVGDRGLSGTLAYHGKTLLEPQDRSLRPAAAFLSWHQQNVFKAPQRVWPEQ